ncbi:N-formylglutamate amidohydrolase [Tateyamaria pelophila]|uniref:N-formylglutamate amidohydrolase n=1 Tax=Tateyamaria pelophila TaxID=328415 RepID=UPI001CC16E83|nr:N-formylglutamate amidohydrolase [Tateyamaria pelophila]
MPQSQTTEMKNYVLSVNAEGASSVVLVCEHASNHIPAELEDLGLSEDARASHAAWDPGAMAVATRMARILDAPLIANGVSRLVYDCNRPPTASDAMLARSEVIDIPGNQSLTQADRDVRTEAYYRPFEAALRSVVQRAADAVLVTVHSFTPVYHGVYRPVEIGILHDSDTRLADTMLQSATSHTNANVQRNAPYGPQDGVTHTLKEHGLKGGHLNVMLEIRSDLIETPAQQGAMAAMIAHWIADACAHLSVPGDVQCRA